MSKQVFLDAGFDLRQVGSPTEEEIDDFTEAYIGAAAAIAEESGVDIVVTERPFDAPGEDGDLDLWQEIHNCLFRENGEWFYDPKEAKAVAAKIKNGDV